MGVWHLSGLGFSPGAVTAPLTNVYIAVECARRGDPLAKALLACSGEPDNAQEIKGLPEALIFFTSPEVASGALAPSSYRDRWFNTQFRVSVPATILAYLEKLCAKTGLRMPKYIYAVKTDVFDFQACFKLVYLTMRALTDKELWVNMTPGTNSCNAALLACAGLQTDVARLYYSTSNPPDLAHPDAAPPNWGDLSAYRPPPTPWHEFPFFSMGMSQLFQELQKRFAAGQSLHHNELSPIMEGCGFGERMLPKLASRDGLLHSEPGDRFSRGPAFSVWEGLMTLPDGAPTDFSAWRRWIGDRAIILRHE